MCSRVGFGGLFWLMLELAAVVGIWLWEVVVGGLSWLETECLHGGVYAGGVCGCVPGGLESLGPQVEVGCDVCRVSK